MIAELLDFLIQDVCVDRANRPIPGDPALCAQARDIRHGEAIPYAATDFDQKSGARYQAVFSYPLDSSPTPRILVSKLLVGPGRERILPNLVYAVDPTRDGYDVFETRGRFVSAIGTSDPGCLAQRISGAEDGDGWIALPLTALRSSGATRHNLRIDRVEAPPPACRAANTGGDGVYRPSSEVADRSVLVEWSGRRWRQFESGKRLRALSSLHFAHWDRARVDNALEAFWFTREYGFSRWEAWIPLARCAAESGADAARCAPQTPDHPLKARCPNGPFFRVWGQQTWVLVDCRDTTFVMPLDSPIRPEGADLPLVRDSAK